MSVGSGKGGLGFACRAWLWGRAREAVVVAFSLSPCDSRAVLLLRVVSKPCAVRRSEIAFLHLPCKERTGGQER